MTQTLREQFVAGQKPLGTFLNQFGGAAIEIIASAGFDYLIIDAEHGLYDVNTIADLLRTADSAGIHALVRIPEPTREWILRALDAGAAGLVVPNIRTIDEVQTLLRYAKYPPAGERGYAPVRAARYGTAGTADAIQKEANANTLLFPQCETKEALTIIDEILQLDGIDGVFVGPYDLSSAMGIIGQFSHPDLISAIDTIRERCEASRKFSLIFAPDATGAQAYYEKGYESVAVGLDYGVLLEGYTQLQKESKA